MTILLLEDEGVVTRLLRFILQARGYAILEATSARQALEVCLVSNNECDLIITDINLPMTSGIEVALQLRARMPRLKIILTSGLPVGYHTDQHSALFSELPSDSVEFLQKPFIPADVLRMVDSLMGLGPNVS